MVVMQMILLLVMMRHSTLHDPCVQETASLVLYAKYRLVGPRVDNRLLLDMSLPLTRDLGSSARLWLLAVEMFMA